MAFVPSIAASLMMVRSMDFTRQRDSLFGRYLAFHMTRLAEAVRLGGQVSMWVGAWLHVGWVVAAGFIVIVLGWTYSLPAWRSRTRAVPSG